MEKATSSVPADGTLMVETLRHGISVEKAKRDGSVTLPSNHYHDYYEIYYLLAGERRFFIKDKAYDLDKGSLVLIRPYTIHRTLNLESPVHERILVNFRKQVVEDILGEDILLSNLQDRSPVYRLDLPNQYLVEELFGKLHAEFKGVDSYSRRLCPVFLCELVSVIYRISDQIAGSPEIAADEAQLKFHRIAKYISENYTEKITLDHLSQKFFLSPFHLCRRFKEITGFSIIEYLNNIRIIEAQHLLRDRDIRVADLAGKVGFDNISHFERTFKRLTGTPPLQYKKKFVHHGDRVPN
jgi:AraC-like DNA-binding protein